MSINTTVYAGFYLLPKPPGKTANYAFTANSKVLAGDASGGTISIRVQIEVPKFSQGKLYRAILEKLTCQINDAVAHFGKVVIQADFGGEYPHTTIQEWYAYWQVSPAHAWSFMTLPNAPTPVGLSARTFTEVFNVIVETANIGAGVNMYVSCEGIIEILEEPEYQ